MSIDRKKIELVKINPLEGAYALGVNVVILLFLLVVVVISNGFLRYFILLIAVFVFKSIVNILIGRLSSRWRRLHYPLMARYSFYAGMVQSAARMKGVNFNIDLAIRELLHSIFPDETDDVLDSYIQKAYKWEKKLPMTKLVLFLKHRIPNANDIKLQKMAKIIRKYFSDSMSDDQKYRANYVKVRLVISELIKDKYGDDECIRYLLKVAEGQAT